MRCYQKMTRTGLTAAALSCMSIGAAFAQDTPAISQRSDEMTLASRNMVLAAHDDLQGRSAYHAVTHRQDGRWYLYIGHHAGEALNPLTGRVEQNGTSIVDVTDPHQPIYVAHIPPSNVEWFGGGTARDTSGAQHVQVCDGGVLPAGRRGRVYLLRSVGQVAHHIFDVTDVRRPRFVTEVVRAENSAYDEVIHVGDIAVAPPPYATHKNFWDCATGEAYLVASAVGWNDQRVVRAFDLSNPARPQHIRDFGLPGTQPGGSGSAVGGSGIHEVTAYGDRLYLAYGVFERGAIQILDRERFLRGDPDDPDPMAPTEHNLRFPQIGLLAMPDFWGAHSAKPLLGIEIADYANNPRGAVRDFLFLVSEGVDVGCTSVRHASFFVDITDARHPFPVSNYQVPARSQPDTNAGIDFCTYGQLGPHAPHASFSEMYRRNVLFVSYFAGGVRAIDIRDPFHPVEIGYFIPRATENTSALPELPRSNAVPLTNNVEIDERGRFVYIVDRAQTGLHVLELTGEIAALANRPAP